MALTSEFNDDQEQALEQIFLNFLASKNRKVAQRDALPDINDSDIIPIVRGLNSNRINWGILRNSLNASVVNASFGSITGAPTDNANLVSYIDAQIDANPSVNVLATVLAGLATTTNAPAQSTDSLIVALGKFQAQINDFLTKFLKLSGGTMTGGLLLNGPPTQDLSPVTKKYFDDNTGGPGGGESNTASNAGTSGIGPFDIKDGINLLFRNNAPGSNKVSISLDVVNRLIVFDIVPGNINTSELNNDAGFTGDQTGAQIKAAYEQELKAFTDALFDKLDTIELNAKDDQTGIEIRDLLFAIPGIEIFTTTLLNKLNSLQESPATTKGDLIVFDGTQLIRLPVGANGQVLKSSSSTPSGLDWDNESGGGGGAPTNLDYIPSPTQGTVTSDTGTNAAIPAATVTNAGLLLPAEKDKLTNIEEFAAADQNADEVPTSPISGVTGNRVQSMMESLKALIDLRLQLSGGTMTGPLILNGDPSNALGAATKQMIDALQLEIDSLDRAIVLQPGLWDASAGTFPANAQLGFKYIVGVTGTIGAREFEVGDTITAIVNNASTTLYASNWLQQSGRNTDNQTGSEVPMNTSPGISGNNAQAIAESLKTYIDDKTSSPIIPNMVNLSYSAVIAHDVSNGLDARVQSGTKVDCQYHFVNLVAGQKGFIKFVAPAGIQVDFRRNGIGSGIQVSKKSSNTTTTGTGTKTTFAYAFDGSEILIVQEDWP